jgi:N6-adenosine-specific RNA methylase IME4
MAEALQTLTIDAEFRAIIPRLATDERAQLEANVLAEGCRDALVVWQGILLDGHNRYEICTAHGIPFDTLDIDLPDRDAAITWIINNQLGRRNLTPEQASYLRGQRYNREKRQGERTDLTSGNSCTKSTANRLGDEYKVSERTIKNDGQFAQAVDMAGDVLGENVKQEILSRDSELSKKDVIALVRLEPEEIEPVAGLVLSGELPNVAAAKREYKRRKDAENLPDVPEPTGKYRCIVIDPPWDFGDEGDVSQMGRGIPKYATMPIDEVERLPVAELADDDCHLYLWITNRSLPKGFRLLEAWGFRYITTLTWCKPSIGVGNYFRNNTEHMLFAVKGSQRLTRFDVGTWFQAPRGKEHSEKPDEAYSLIASCSPGPRLDMFARKARDGFTIWGNL